MEEKQNYGSEQRRPGMPGPGMPGMPGMDHRLAHAYVPYQRFTNSYPPEEALRRGTLFPDLYFPYRRGSGFSLKNR